MPIVKVANIVWGRLRSPDLDLAEEFLTGFGMTRVARTGNALFMRSSEPSHHLHVTELGRPARAEGAPRIEHLDEPGGAAGACGSAILMATKSRSPTGSSQSLR
ncbi:MAG TPA: hypothetical protein VMU87_06700 [Stellaceae bacterium]|nr:hypothetical protein [Stellaceae bacterium]